MYYNVVDSMMFAIDEVYVQENLKPFQQCRDECAPTKRGNKRFKAVAKAMQAADAFLARGEVQVHSIGPGVPAVPEVTEVVGTKGKIEAIQVATQLCSQNVEGDQRFASLSKSEMIDLLVAIRSDQSTLAIGKSSEAKIRSSLREAAPKI